MTRRREGCAVSTPLKSAFFFLRSSLREREQGPVQYLLGHRLIVSLFDKHAASVTELEAQRSPRRSPRGKPSSPRESPQDSLEVDLSLTLGPMEASAAAGYVDLERQTVLKARGVTGKGKLLWSRSERGKQTNAKVYAELCVLRIRLGVMNSILQYGAVYQRSVGKWITTRAIELAKRDPIASRSDLAAQTRPESDKSEVLFEVVGATVKIEPILLQALSESGSALLEFNGLTAVYSLIQSLSAGKRVTAADQLEHMAVFTMKTLRVSLYGTPSPR